MGQYYKLINLDKREFVDAHAIGNGLKIHEQQGWAYSTQVVAAHLVMEPDSRSALCGSWQGDRVAFVGDYGDSQAIPGMPGATVADAIKNDAEKLYHVDEDETWKDISLAVREMMTAIYSIKYEGGGWCDIVEANGQKVRPFIAPDFIFSTRSV